MNEQIEYNQMEAWRESETKRRRETLAAKITEAVCKEWQRIEGRTDEAQFDAKASIYSLVLDAL